MLPQNLLIPLLGLGLYTQCNNINLSNNTSIMIIILALIMEQRKIDELCAAQDNDNDTNIGIYSQTNRSATGYAQPYYNQPYFAQPYFAPVVYDFNSNNCGCNCNHNCGGCYYGYQTATPYPYNFYPPYYGRSGYSTGGCNCNSTYNSGYTTSRCGCGTNIY